MEDFIRYDKKFHNFLVEEVKKVQYNKYFNYDEFIKEHKHKIHDILLIHRSYNCFVEKNYAITSAVYTRGYYNHIVSLISDIFSKYLVGFPKYCNIILSDAYNCILNISNEIYNVYIYNISIYLETYLIKDISDIIIKYIKK